MLAGLAWLQRSLIRYVIADAGEAVWDGVGATAAADDQGHAKSLADQCLGETRAADNLGSR